MARGGLANFGAKRAPAFAHGAGRKSSFEKSLEAKRGSGPKTAAELRLEKKRGVKKGGD